MSYDNGLDQEFDAWWKREKTVEAITAIPDIYHGFAKKVAKAAYRSAALRAAKHWQDNHDDQVRKKQHVSGLYGEALKRIAALEAELKEKGN